MKNPFKYLLCTLFAVAIAGVAFAQEGDEAPEPTQTKMVELHKVQLGEVPCFIIKNVEVAPLLTLAYCEPVSDRAVWVAGPVQVVSITMQEERYAYKTPWLHRCSRTC